MALETLKDTKEIVGFCVKHVDNPSYYDSNANDQIIVNHALNTITFKIQNGPTKEHGVNGCQVDTIIHAAKLIIEGLDSKFPCSWNKMAIELLQGAILALEDRKAEREARNVEGTSQQ